jgi:hypothetical protein
MRVEWGDLCGCDADRPGTRSFSLHPALPGTPWGVGFGLGSPDEKRSNQRKLGS